MAPTSRSSRRGRAGWGTTSATRTRRTSGRSTTTSSIRRRLRPLSGELRARLPASAVARGADRFVRTRTASLCRRDGVRRLQPQPRSVRRVLERADARRPRTAGRCTRRCVELDVPAMIHVSDDVQPALPHDRLALPRSRHDGVHAGDDVGSVQDFPRLRWIIPHGGGAVPVPLGAIQGHGRGERQERLAHARRDDGQRLVRHVRLPPAGIDLLLDVVPTDNILFASEMVGAVKGHQPRYRASTTTTPRYVDRAAAHATSSARRSSSCNVQRVYPRPKIGA